MYNTAVVCPSVFANDTANEDYCTDYGTGANKVRFNSYYYYYKILICRVLVVLFTVRLGFRFPEFSAKFFVTVTRIRYTNLDGLFVSDSCRQQ